MILNIFEILSSWHLGSADAWPAWNKMLCMVCYMLHCTHLHDRYDKSDFFSSDLISSLNCFPWNSLSNIFSVNHIQVGSFQGCSRIGVRKCPPPPLPKICHTYPTMMKLSTVIPYLTKIQNIYKSRGTPITFCWHQYFFTKNQQLLLYQEIQI